MNTYKRGVEPTGCPLTWVYVLHEGCEIVMDDGTILRELHASTADAICAAFHAAAEWRKLAEAQHFILDESVGVVRNYVPRQCENLVTDYAERANAMVRRFDAMKETFGD